MNRDWIELWLDRNDGARPEPLRVGYSPGTTVRELARALDNPGHHHEGLVDLLLVLGHQVDRLAVVDQVLDLVDGEVGV